MSDLKTDLKTDFDFYTEFETYVKGGKSKITTLINSDEKGTSNQRMDIYKDAYKFRLVDVLFEDFKTVHKILGDDDFSKMAFDYVEKYPSTSFSIRNFGQNMSKYLSEEIPYKNHQYLAEIADFEWSKGLVFDSGNSEVLTIKQLSEIPVDSWEEAKFEFIPAIKRLVYNYNIPQIWQAINDG